MKNIFYAFLLAGIAVQVFGVDNFCNRNITNGHYQFPANCAKFYQCSYGRTFVMPCPANTWFSPANDTCEYPDKIKPKPNCTPPPGFAFAAAASSGVSSTSAPVLLVSRPECKNKAHGSVPHESECSKFVKCNGNGLGVVKSCPTQTNFDPDYRVCVWESIYDCKGPNFCKGKSDGDYVHTSQCDAFFKCVGGLTYTEVCPAGLWYNGATNKCDYPHLVNCPVAPSTTQNPTATTSTSTTTTSAPTTTTSVPTTTTVDPSLQGLCSGRKDGNYIHPNRCDLFISCVAGRVLYIRNCPAGLYYNEQKDLCDWPTNVNCPQKSTTTTQRPTTTTTTQPPTTSTTTTQPPTTTTTTTQPPTTTTTTQPPTTTTTTTQPPTTTTTTTQPPTTTTTQPPTTTTTTTQPPTTTTTTTQPPTTDSLNVFCDNKIDGNYVHPHRCDQFISCVAQRIVYVRNCPAGLYYNNKLDQCDWPTNVNCPASTAAPQPQTTKAAATTQPPSPATTQSTAPPKTVDPSLQGFCNGRNDGNYESPNRCDQFVSCVAKRIIYVRNCPSGLYYNKNVDQCDWPRNVICRGSPNTPATTPTTAPATNPPSVTTAKPSGASCSGKPNGNYRDPDRCDGYVSCSNGIVSKMDCPIGLWYNQLLDQCDYPHNVQCTASPQTPATTTTTTTTTTTQAPSTLPPVGDFCKSKAPGDYSDPSRCEGYISCVGAIGWRRNCPGGLHYNDVLGVCDYPVNVQCANRLSKRVVEDEFSCAGKSGGTYKHPQCNKYYQCKDNSMETEVKECPKHMNFHPITEVCVWSYSYFCEDPKFCIGKEDGKYKNINNCYGFYECENGLTYPKNCPPFLRFNGSACVPASKYVCL